MIPENAGVANAVGAITGNVVVEESILIRPHNVAVIGITGYYCYSSDEKKEFHEYKEALGWAVMQAEAVVRKIAADRGADTVEAAVEVTSNEAEIRSDYGGDRKPDSGPGAAGGKLFIETMVTGRATGKIKMDERNLRADSISARVRARVHGAYVREMAFFQKML